MGQKFTLQSTLVDCSASPVFQYDYADKYNNFCFPLFFGVHLHLCCQQSRLETSAEMVVI